MQLQKGGEKRQKIIENKHNIYQQFHPGLKRSNALTSELCCKIYIINVEQSTDNVLSIRANYYQGENQINRL